MRYLTVREVVEIHRRMISRHGGATGIRDLGALHSAVAQPRMTFGGAELYASLEEKAAALGFSLVMNHAFVDGNKRTGHAAIESFLVLNGSELRAPVDESERVLVSVASGTMDKNALVAWLREHATPRTGETGGPKRT